MSALVDAALIALLIYRPSIWLAIWIAVLIVLRWTPYLADEIASMLDLESYHGLTAIMARFLLPGWTPAHELMSRTIDLSREKVRAPIHVSIPGITDTNAIPPADRDITKDAWLVALAEARDDRGKELFSANKIAALMGGNHNLTMARIKEVRTGDVAQYRQDDETTAPATYPVSKS